MLLTFRVRHLAIVEDVTLEFAPGFNVLTGETGAGKSILIDALSLILGARADRQLVRSGAERAIVEASFDLSDCEGARDWAREVGLVEDLEEAELLIRREIPVSGSGRLRVNGSPCTLALLRELGSRLLEVHGQHEHQTLLSPERHVGLTDIAGHHDPILEQVAAAHAEVLEARATLDGLQLGAAEREARIAELKQIVGQLEALDPQPGEQAELERQRNRLRHAERMTELLQGLVQACYEGDQAAAGQAAGAARAAAELAEIDPSLLSLAERLGQAAIELEDVGAGFREYRDRTDFDPARLESVEARLVALQRALLRFGPDEEAMLAHAERARSELAALDGDGDRLPQAEDELARVTRRYVGAARRLGRARRVAASKLVPDILRQLKALALGRAELELQFHDAGGPEVEDEKGNRVPLNARGAERAELMLAANPGEPLRPLARVASGGELSRVMLALHAVIDGASGDRVLVFDEVDAGVGGAVADAVGARLARLARSHQVLCVTHLPQVAAYGDRHLRVRKQSGRGRTFVEVAPLSKEERVAEVARMLSAKEASSSARRHAEELLRSARDAGAAGQRSGS